MTRMGARYLLVEFDDAESADKLRQQLDDRTRAGRPFRVVGLFAKPTRTCECDPETAVTNRTGESRLRRGRKLGWWVCSVCKRPDPQLTGLRNLLKPQDIIDSPSWAARGYTWTHYISALSGLVLGDPGRKFWNTRD